MQTLQQHNIDPTTRSVDIHVGRTPPVIFCKHRRTALNVSHAFHAVYKFDSSSSSSKVVDYGVSLAPVAGLQTPNPKLDETTPIDK